MEWIYIEERDYLVSHWAGGTTAQIAIAPEGALYSDRDFLWRVSSARVELEESVFTSLPDYHRWISTLAGGMVLSHQGGEKITLAPYQIHQFDGGWETRSWGRCTDFNLMLRKGKARGSVRSFRLAAGESRTVRAEIPADGQFPETCLLLLCGEGTASAVLNGERIEMAPMSSLLVKGAARALIEVEAIENTAFMVAEIQS